MSDKPLVYVVTVCEDPKRAFTSLERAQTFARAKLRNRAEYAGWSSEDRTRLLAVIDDPAVSYRDVLDAWHKTWGSPEVCIYELPLQ